MIAIIIKYASKSIASVAGSGSLVVTTGGAGVTSLANVRMNGVDARWAASPRVELPRDVLGEMLLPAGEAQALRTRKSPAPG